MSIQESVFKLTTEIIKHEKRQEIYELITKMRISKTAENQVDIDHSQLWYFAHQENIQFLGLLILNENAGSVSLNETGIVMNKLSNHDLKIIESWYRTTIYILEYFTELLSPYGNIIKNISNPYYHYAKPSLITNSEIISLSDQTIKNIRVELESHPTCLLLKDLSQKFKKEIEQISSSLPQAVLKIENDIHRASITSTNREIFDLQITQNLMDLAFSDKTVAKLIFAIINLRSTMRIISQLIFQATYQNNLPQIGNNNITKIHNHHSTNIGKVLTCSIQPTGEEISTKPGDIIYYNIDEETHKYKGIAKICNFTFKMSQEEGTIMKFGLRLIDDHLNYFENL
ncbi:hypothetical protein EHQ24_12430 [Leptospira noumeaensis]|uniref:Uncharacterized protein n=1 Tax=Leptospira noumeaensis TaxID=2484964 RepID=A0A4R9I7G1_9LEPT|nr:hypothetical protein [Leptospira noumeaensis]TGK82072.1 hypothetical protein EHQ24_12430 [Leptospira noumeaensis]